MNYEKKYKDLLERARKLHDENWDGCKICIESLFSELAESEDEKIRKSIIKFLIDVNNGAYTKSELEIASWITWLEKQGESIKIKKGKNYLCTKTHKYAGVEWIEGVKYYSSEDYSLVNQGCTYYCPKYSKEEHNNFFKEVEYDSCLEKQVEQKPADKVEPKFKVHDWIKHNKANFIFQINKVTDNKYEFNNPDGYNHSLPIKSVDKKYHLWTIQDANNGDVLAESKGDVILLFRGIGNTKWHDVIDYHCYYDCYQKDFFVQKDVDYWGHTENNQLVLATKEQRELLFQKIRDAGYEWDAEKKLLYELKNSDDEKLNGGIVLEDFNEGDEFYNVNLAYLNKKQVEEIEKLVDKWNPK